MVCPCFYVRALRFWGSRVRTGAGGVEQADKNKANTARQPGSSLFAFMEIRLPYIMISPPLYIRFFESVKFHIDKLSFENVRGSALRSA